MNRMPGIMCVALLLAVPASDVSAQLLPAKDGAIVYGHHHVNASNVEDHKKFWADTLGGTVVTVGADNLEIIRFANALIFMRSQKATGGSKGTSLDHIGFSVPNLRRVMDKVKAGGYRVVTTQEAPANVTVKDDIGQVDAGGVTGIAYVMSPDDVKVELVEVKAQTAPIVSHHLHFFGQEQNEMRAWYMKVFGAAAGVSTNPSFIRAELPGIGLNFTQSGGPVAGTRGRALDHIGFEVTDLDEFAKKLDAQGIMTTVRNIPALTTKVAFVTDPWGTLIELSDGLRLIP